MRDFRRSVFRLLLMTAVLLLGAWVLMKVAQYKGDLQAILRDLQNGGVARFVQEKVVPFYEQQFLPFFRDKLGPKVEELTAPARDFLSKSFGG